MTTEARIPAACFHPDLQEAVSTLPELDIFSDLNRTREITRKMFAELPRGAEPPAAVETVPAGEGRSAVTVHISRPPKQAGPLPGVLHIHGGGYVLGFAAMDDPLCQRIAREVNCVVVSVDYRLAPEHPYPAALEDCYAALEWMAANAAGLGIDPERLAVTGASAGGGLTVATALLARDRKGPVLKFMAPLCPMLDNTNTTPSSMKFWTVASGTGNLTKKTWQLYLGAAKDPVPPYAVPAKAEDLSGLPATFTFVGGLDLFRDETINFVAGLARAKVPVEFHLYPGCFHGFENLLPNCGISKKADSDYLSALRQALHG
ncbi:MAG: alpha/beta hydrolase [Firmicutes bacterium]|jgi:acetyl esterase/lipase|nr:alpha/beta hydrolase [Bacillota bacterium]